MSAVPGLVLILTLALVWGAAGGAPADSPRGNSPPHGAQDPAAGCTSCHEADGTGRVRPHGFRVSVIDACRSCHPPERLGRSHPVGMDPYRALGRIEMPAELPLQWSDEAASEVVTCGTCHNPHLPRFAPRKLHRRQRPARGRPGLYLTYFLRMPAGDEEGLGQGFAVLCHACHPKL
ncbi:MAG: hypothetical protein Kow0092_34200 [Deferrisomatales bacterium]